VGEPAPTRALRVDPGGEGEPGLRGYALAAVAAAAVDPDTLAEAPELGVMDVERRGVERGGTTWLAGLARYLRDPAARREPLVRFADALELETLEVLAVELAAAVEDDPRIGRALARLQAPVGGSRPTLGLLAACLAPAAPPRAHPLDVLVAGAALRTGLLHLADGEAPLAERSVSVPVHLCGALRGRDLPVPHAALADAMPAVPLPSDVLERAARHAAALRDEEGRLLVIRSGSREEGRAVAAAVAGALGQRPVFLDGTPVPGLGPWLVLRGLLPVVCVEPGPGERHSLPRPPGYRGPMLALCGPDGVVELEGAAGLSWHVGVPDRQERERLWEAALGDRDAAAALARTHRHGSGRIAQLGRAARHLAALHGRGEPAFADVVAAARTTDSTGLEALAQRIPDEIPDAALVASPALHGELHALLLRCQARDGLEEGLGASAAIRYTPGVRALLVGPSGTGKTLAAAWLATRLGLPLFRVDLSAVTSKYIGETEKNLATLLARAEQAEVVLLFDEADSLFGKRTEVRDSNDRFANAQTNYLLQRIEQFDGIAVLTSNSRSRFDSAFTRRLDIIVDFPLPGPDERRALWQAHLGGGHRLEPREFNRLAAAADLAGGHIRNVVLAAAVLAADAGRPIEWADLLQGLTAELRKLGRPLPPGLRGER
jgi:hypothetical protein